MNVKATYNGPLFEGAIECPRTGRTVRFSGKRDKDGKPIPGPIAIEMPREIALELEYQNPGEWTVPDSITKAANERRDAEKKAAEKRDEKPAVTPAIEGKE